MAHGVGHLRGYPIKKFNFFSPPPGRARQPALSGGARVPASASELPSLQVGRGSLPSLLRAEAAVPAEPLLPPVPHEPATMTSDIPSSRGDARTQRDLPFLLLLEKRLHLLSFCLCFREPYPRHPSDPRLKLLRHLASTRPADRGSRLVSQSPSNLWSKVRATSLRLCDPLRLCVNSRFLTP
jgi:hypothetical protein